MLRLFFLSPQNSPKIHSRIGAQVWSAAWVHKAPSKIVRIRSAFWRRSLTFPWPPKYPPAGPKNGAPTTVGIQKAVQKAAPKTEPKIQCFACQWVMPQVPKRWLRKATRAFLVMTPPTLWNFPLAFTELMCFMLMASS